MIWIWTLCITVPLLAILCWHDCKYRRLPNAYTLGLAVLGIVWRFVFGGFHRIERRMYGNSTHTTDCTDIDYRDDTNLSGYKHYTFGKWQCRIWRRIRVGYRRDHRQQQDKRSNIFNLFSDT